MYLNNYFWWSPIPLLKNMITPLILVSPPPAMNNECSLNGVETNCRIAHVLGILQYWWSVTDLPLCMRHWGLVGIIACLLQNSHVKFSVFQSFTCATIFSFKSSNFQYIYSPTLICTFHFWYKQSANIRLGMRKAYMCINQTECCKTWIIQVMCVSFLSSNFRECHTDYNKVFRFPNMYQTNQLMYLVLATRQGDTVLSLNRLDLNASNVGTILSAITGPMEVKFLSYKIMTNSVLSTCYIILQIPFFTQQPPLISPPVFEQKHI